MQRGLEKKLLVFCWKMQFHQNPSSLQFGVSFDGRTASAFSLCCDSVRKFCFEMVDALHLDFIVSFQGFLVFVFFFIFNVILLYFRVRYGLTCILMGLPWNLVMITDWYLGGFLFNKNNARVCRCFATPAANVPASEFPLEQTDGFPPAEAGREDRAR